MTDNLQINTLIWEQVCESTPYQLKKVDFGRKFLSIDAYTQIERATEIFGPMGHGFGLMNINHEILACHKGTSKEPTVDTNYMLMTCDFWYKIPETDVHGKFPMVNGMELTANKDTPKKLMTNTLTKALSYLGFNYDVFKGAWDDDPYIDRPDIPAPAWMISNFKLLLGSGAFSEDAQKQLTTFQMNAGWTLQSVKNFTDDAPAVLVERGIEVPDLKTGSEEDNGVPAQPEAKIPGKVEEEKGRIPYKKA